MRQYAHDYVWGCQDRRDFPPAPGAALVGWLAEGVRRLARAARTARPAA